MSSDDPLRDDDAALARATPPEERARQAFAAFRTGVCLKRAALRERFPGAAEQEIDRLLEAWLLSDDRSVA